MHCKDATQIFKTVAKIDPKMLDQTKESVLSQQQQIKRHKLFA
jgi:uncharacterized protein YaaR (DUF327 family)